MTTPMSMTMSAALDLSTVTLLLQEVQTVTSAMRRNQRWASVPASTYASSGMPASISSRGRRSTPGPGMPPAPRGKRRTDDEGDLMLTFVELRRNLTGVTDIMTFPPLAIIDPFLALVRSPLTSGPITSLALTSLHSLALHVLPLYLPATPPPAIGPASPLQIAMMHLTSALAQCRFPSSSPQQDELVLLRLLRIIEALTAPTAVAASSSRTPQSLLDNMNDEGVCELLEVGLGMLARGRLSEGLRSSAQMCVQAITRACFLRLRALRGEDVEIALRAAEESSKETTVHVPVERKLSEETPEEKSDEIEEGKGKEKEIVLDEKEEEKEQEPEKKDPEAKDTESKDGEPVPPQFVPYGLPTMLELLRVLIALLNPTDQAHTDSMRMSALAVLNAALEVGGGSIGNWPELREGVRDEGCRYLFQLTRSDSPLLLAQSLRTTSTLFSTLLPHLKLQLELFLSYLVDRLTPPTPSPLPLHLRAEALRPSRPGTPMQGGTTTADGGLEAPVDKSASSTPKPYALLPPVPAESKELWFETLTQIATQPSFMVDCWANFDCSTDSEDIFERMIGFLTRGVYPTGPRPDGAMVFEGLESPQLLCLEILLSFINSMANRLEDGDEAWPADAPMTPDELAASKSRKAVLVQGEIKFNIKPKDGIKFLEENGIIGPGEGPEPIAERRLKSIAHFLRSSSRLDKKLLGEYISRPDQVDLLKVFIGLFDFKGRTIADALRDLLETFRLPGESQPISRITEVFADHFFSFQPPEIANQDAVYVLAYSVIMLNTDLHNPQNRKRMTVEDYRRNVRGVNDGKDFDPEYLAAIHESIRKREIILPEEHVGQPGFDYAWKGLMTRSRTAGLMVSCNTAQFDEAMFQIAWRPLISSIAYAFTMSSTDEHVIQHAITGFRHCATLAGHFQIPEVFDTIVQSLANATDLLDDTEDGYHMGNYPLVERDGSSVTVSPLAIRFGQSYRSQLATVVLFTIANGHGNSIREGWGQIFEMFQTLFLHSLLPARMLQMEDFLAGTTTIPMKLATPAAAPERRPEGGLLSTLSSYLLSPYGSSTDALAVETSEEDVENTLVAVDSLASCKLEELYAEILNLQVEPLIRALRAIRSLAEVRTTHRLEPRNTPDGLLRFDGQLPYDPACVFHLEMMVSLAAHGTEHIAETWPIIFEYIATLLSSAQSYSVLLIERAVVGLLRLCLIVSDHPALRDQLYIALDVLRSLPSSVLNAVSEQLMAGVAKILDKDAGVVKSQTEWGLIIALFRATVAHPEASKVTLAIVQKMATGGEPGLSADNFGGVVALLDEFATAAGAAAAGRHQMHRRRSDSVAATLGPTVERGLTALDSLYELRNAIPSLIERSGKNTHDAFNAFWLPPLLVIGKQCVNGYREIRQRAISYLQRLLLSPQLMSTDGSTLPIIFDRVLFPVLDELLKPAVYERDHAGAAEMRLRAATLLCKVFLQHVVNLTEASTVVGAQFVRVLDKLERFMRGDRDMLNEVSESLKNVVLVMHSSGLVIPPSEPDTRTAEQREVWAAAAPRIERMVPGFLAEALAPPPQQVRVSTSSERKSADVRKSAEAEAKE